jgi:hypothetical protein
MHPQTPAVWEGERPYWLCRCDRFRVAADGHDMGVVDSVRFGSRLDQPDAVVIRTGRVHRSYWAVSQDDVVAIHPEERLLVVDSSVLGWRRPVLVDELRTALRGAIARRRRADGEAS